MARRWQLSLWVLAGLVLTVVALWDRATVSAVAGRVSERTETADGSGGLDADDAAPSDLAYGELDAPGPLDGGSNVLRPTTTTTTRPTSTTTSTSAPPGPPTSQRDGDDGTGTGGEKAPGSATTIPVGDGEPSGSTGPDGSSSTAPNGSSSTVAGDPALTTAYHTDFAGGSLIEGRWSVADSVGHDGWGLLRGSAVAVVPDPSAAGGQVLAITARMGSGAESDRAVSGAVRLLGHGQTGGRYTIRARVDPDPDGATSGVVLLAPTASNEAAGAAGEIRIMETGRNRSTRTPVESTVRWNGSGGGTASIEKAHRSADRPVSAAAWHVYTLDWTADRVTVAVDGEPLNLTVDPSRVPRGPMDLAIRLDPVDTPTAPGEQPVLSGEVRLLVDWIRIEQFTGDVSPQ